MDPILLSPEDHPRQLAEIADPPKRLWYRGALPHPESTLLTVVGARKHSHYGKEACETLIAGLKGYDITIVSGLALGIDTLAHRAALKAGLRTLAVPGSGLSDKVLYPRTNIGLAREIVNAGDGLLSEYEPETEAATWTFPQRNRIMAGLSKATLVIEAERRSGTLITSRLATEYNRDVFAVPGSIFSSLSEGPNMLISLGATPIHTSEDILLALGFDVDASRGDEHDFSHLSETEQDVMNALSAPVPRDELLSKIGLSASEGNIVLMKMEIAGLIVDGGDGVRRA